MYAHYIGRLFFLLQRRPSIHLHSRSHNTIANRACIPDIDEGDVEGKEWEEHPEHVEENEVDPEEHEVTSVKILVHRKPFGGEGHETCTLNCKYIDHFDESDR
jgi:hypothetical protein